MTTNRVRLAIIGCGAATSVGHLPAARRVREVQVVALADPNLARAAMLGQRFGVARISADYHEFLGEIDGAIVATPHALHAQIAAELLERGTPAMVSRPSRCASSRDTACPSRSCAPRLCTGLSAAHGPSPPVP